MSRLRAIWRSLRWLAGVDRAIWFARVVRDGDGWDVKIGVLTAPEATAEDVYAAKAAAWGEVCRRMGRRVPCPRMEMRTQEERSAVEFFRRMRGN